MGFQNKHVFDKIKEHILSMEHSPYPSWQHFAFVGIYLTAGTATSAFLLLLWRLVCMWWC